MIQQNNHLLPAIFARFTAYFVISAAVVTGIVLSLNYQKHLFELSRSQDRESLRLSLAAKSIIRDLRVVIADIRTLARLHVLADYINTETPATRKRLENAFVNMGENERIYDQIRYLNHSGMEIVRVNFRAGKAIRVPDNQLQDKSQRYYVGDSLKLGAGEIYISRMDLNVENGQIERPFKPVIRVATPVLNRNGDVQGILIMNYLATELLSDFRDFMAGSWGEPALVNDRGYWVYSQNKQDEWGFMFGNERSFADRFPMAWQYIREQDAGTIETESGLFLFATARPYSGNALRELGVSGGNIAERNWKLITKIPLSQMRYSPLRILNTRRTEFVGLGVLVSVLSLFLATLRTKYAANSKALRQSESMLADAQQLAHVGNWVWDIPSARISWSAEAYNIFGLKPEHNISYETFIAMVHANDRSAVIQAIDDALHRKAPYDLDHRIVRADNTQRTVHERGEVTFDKNGTPIRMFGTVQDITERKIIEEKMRDSEERFRQLAENIDDVFWLTEWPQNRVIYVSPAFERIWGFTVQQLYESPMTWLQGIVSEDRPRVAEVFLKQVANGGFDVTYRIARPDGDLRWIRDRAFEIRNKKGEVYRLAGVATDITKRVEAEQELQNYKAHLEQLVAERTAELQASNKELESFNYSLAHDLRTPLRAVTSFSQILSEEAAVKLTLVEKDHLNRISRAGKHMAWLLDGIAELGRISRRKMKFRTVHLSVAAQQIINRLQQSQPERLVKVRVMPDLQCMGDDRMLRVVLTNLLENAWKHTRDSSPAIIEFGATTESDKTIYYVRDNGIGFNMKHVDRLFEPFQHVYERDENQSTGISLAAAHRIIQRHKGRMWAEAGENSGATFYFTLPEPGKDSMTMGLPLPTVESKS